MSDQTGASGGEEMWHRRFVCHRIFTWRKALGQRVGTLCQGVEAWCCGTGVERK